MCHMRTSCLRASREADSSLGSLHPRPRCKHLALHLLRLSVLSLAREVRSERGNLDVLPRFNCDYTD